jgi:Cu/Ag efflux protein CusF
MSVKRMSRVLGLALAAAFLAPRLTLALEKDRGNIVSTDWQKMEMEIKDPKGRVGTWKVARNAVVAFTDKKDQFPNPKLSDLRPPMYIHFVFEAGTPGVIQSIEVVEVGFEPSRGGPGVEQTGVITALDANIGHVEVDLGAGKQTFEVDPKSQLRDFNAGDRVTLLIESRGPREVVTRMRRVGGGSAAPAGGPVRAAGRVVRLASRSVVISHDGGSETYEVANPSLLNDLRPGDRVRFTYETRGRTKVITAIE